MARRAEEGFRRFGASFGFALAPLCALGMLAASSHAQTPKTAGTPRRIHKAKPKPAPVPPPVVVELPPAPPPPPPTPGELPPTAPQVSYQEGQLTILAENSTLSDILRAVASATGANFDAPPVGGSDRVWIQLGPGPARAVLASLLSGTDLDYVIQSSDSDPAVIQSVLLTARMKGDHPFDSSGSAQTFAARSNRFRTRNPGMIDSTAGDPDAENPSPSDSAPTAQNSPEPAATSSADTDRAAAAPAADAPSSESASARPLPLAVTEAEAHPAPASDPQQGVPQLLNLFELRRQLQVQQNAQQKSAAVTSTH